MSPARRRPPDEPESPTGGFIDFDEPTPPTDPAVNALLNRTERRQAEARLPQKEREKKRKEREKMRARRDEHTTYDIPIELRQRIRELSDQERVPASQLAALALLRFVSDLERGEIDLSLFKTPSRSPRFDFNLLLPLELLGGKAKGKEPKSRR